MNRPGQSLLSRLSFRQPKQNAVKQALSEGSVKTILHLLAKLKSGHLKMTLPDGAVREFGNSSDVLHAEIHIFDWSVFRQVLSHGDIGFAESYIRGDWSTANLKNLLTLVIRNRQILEKAIYGSWYGSLFYRVRHWIRSNSKLGSQKNIHAHYDLGNAFYALWLDPTMSYSSALFNGDEKLSLADAQKAKITRALQSIQAKPGDHILEIGCGWGGFMEEAILQKLNITGITLSTEQQRFSEERLKNIQSVFESSSKFQVYLQDYRDCTDQFDGIASIEMFEAVGEKYWPEYFKTIARCLKASGKACVQTIVIAEDLFDRYRDNTDFIQQYVFPGGMLPSRSSFEKAASKAGLQIESEFAFGADYAKTLELWHDAFNQKLFEIYRLGFDDAFIRLWNFYLMYCAAGFSEGNINVVQFTLSHANKNRSSRTSKT